MKGQLAVEQLPGSSTKVAQKGSMDESKIDEIVLREIKGLVARENLQFVDMRNVFPRCRGQMTQELFDAGVKRLEHAGTLYSAGEDHVYGTTD